MRCIKCIKKYANACFTDNITNHKCSICDEVKMYGSSYNPAHCCVDCSSKNHECQDCGSKEIVSEHFRNVFDYEEKNIIIFYHGNCNDGTGGAYAAYKYFGNKAAYVPLTHGDYFPADYFVGKEIYFIDFALPYVETMKLRENNTVIIIDHHKTAQENLKGLDNCFFDMNHSGAYLAHKYFFPNEPVPEFLLYIEDSDLYKFDLKNTKNFIAGFNIVNKNFESLELLDIDKKYVKSVIADGIGINAYLNTVYKDLCSRSYPVVLNGVEGLAVNASWQFASAVGNMLASKSGTFGLVWHTESDKLKCSLRSIGDFDVSKLARVYNGGGHKNASAFTLNKGTNEFNELLINISGN